MARLAEYFAVIGIPKASSAVDPQELKGKVLQRFPLKDRKDACFPEGIEMLCSWLTERNKYGYLLSLISGRFKLFTSKVSNENVAFVTVFCQPSGWEVSYYMKPVTFYVSVLTDMSGNRSYAACLSFYEPFTLLKKQQEDGDIASMRVSADSGISSQDAKHDVHMEAFFPKCLCLVSKFTYIDILKSCLTSIYMSWVNGNNTLLEKIIGSVLGFVRVPTVGAPAVTFSIGIGDKKILSPPFWDQVPLTGKSVANVFRQLGMHNVLSLFCALVTENKVLMFSSSYSLLTSASLGLLALLYPLKFSYVYIPILPSALLDFVNAPTPFIMGIHNDYKDNLPEVNDVIIVDLDGGHVSVPESVNLSCIPEPYLSRTRHALTLVLHPNLVVADMAFPPHVSSSPLKLQDKEIRAIFMRLFAQIYSGYRSCLKVIRVHPRPVITFHKGTFMEKRGVFGDDFFNKVLDSISFGTFICDRGPPHRTCDLFDELVANIDETLQSEMGLDAEIMSNIQQIAKRLYDNEPCCETEEHMPAMPSAVKNEAPFTFPILDATIIEKHLEDETGVPPDPTGTVAPLSLDKVPYGTGVFSYQTRHYINLRKLEVLHDCVAYIFENKISEARKALPSVQRALKSRGAQLALCQELAARSEQHRAVLEHDQFNLVISLMNCALQDDASLTDGAVASALLPLTSEFCRNLAPGVMQFAYTCVQGHPIWHNAQFWEETFYSDVQIDIKKIYNESAEKKGQSTDKLLVNSGLFERLSTPRSSRSSITVLATSPPAPKHDLIVITQSGGYQQLKDDTEPGITNEALDIAATQLGKWSTYSDSEQNTMVTNEESIVYSQAIHFVNRMVYLMIPLNVYELVKRKRRPVDVVLENSGASRDNVDGSLANTSIGSDSRSNVAKLGHSTNGSIVETTDGGIVGSVYGDMHGGEHWEDDGETDTIMDEVERSVVRFVDRVGTTAGISTEHLKSLYALVPSVITMHTESLEPVYREHKQLAPIRKAKIIRPAMLPGEEMQMKGLRCYLIPDGRETGTGLSYGGPILFPAEGAVFVTNYRIIFKGTPVNLYASEMVVTRSFPLGSLTREKKIGSQYLLHLKDLIQECVQLRSATFQMLKLCFDEEVGAENVDVFRKTIMRLRYPISVLSTFAFKSTTQVPAKCVRLVVPPSDKQVATAAATKGPKTRAKNAPVKKEGSGLRHLTGSIKRSRYKNGVSSPSLSRRQHYVSSDGSIENLPDDHVDFGSVPITITNAAIPDIGKLSSMPYCREYARLGFGSLLKDSPKGAWRISMINLTYGACRSYPAVLVVPHQVCDDSILRVVKNHRQMRFPVATWKHPRNKAVLLRSSAIERSSVASIIRSGVAASGGSTDAIRSSNVEQDKFLSAIVSATPVSKSKATAKQQSLAQSVNMSPATLDLRVMDSKSDKGLLTVDTIDKAVFSLGWEPAAVYVFGDKSNLKNLKKESYPKTEFVPVEMPDLRDLKSSLKKLLRVCCPSAPPKDNSQHESFLKSLQESEWLSQLSLTMRIAGAVVDLVDIQGSSVLVSFEDGWDTTSQVISMAEVMLDPYYRTINGFKVLIEKEWLSFGHRFSHRCNHTQATQSSGFAPVFLQFLDGVHQILSQFPLSFEFNEYFLHFLAYHHVSMRFRTFLLDSDHERQQMGWLTDEDDEQKMHRKAKSRGKSLWEYVDELHRKSSLFYNFRYSKEHSDKVLRPHCNVANLKFWSYYVSENVSTGPTFDQELINETETATEEGQQKLDDKYHATRRCLSGMYGGTIHNDSDECSYQLQEYNRIEEEADRTASCWKKVWVNLGASKSEMSSTKKKPLSMDTIISRHRSAVVHKRDTMDIVLKGKLQIEDYSQQGFTQPHNFEPHSFVTPTNCDFCLQFMWYMGKGAFKCKECGFNSHEKCLSRVPEKCRCYRNLNEQNANLPATSNKSLHEPASSNKSAKLLCGHLWKKGALFKQWKQRYFVLDTERHELRYYDSEVDIHCQGLVELSEIISCELSQQNASNEKQVYFDLRTDKRSYNFYAVSKEEADKWISRLQNLDT